MNNNADHSRDRRQPRRGLIASAFVVTYSVIPVIPLMLSCINSKPNVGLHYFLPFLNLFNSGVANFILGPDWVFPAPAPATFAGTASLIALAIFGIARRKWSAYVLFAVLLLLNLVVFICLLPGLATAF